MKINFAHLCDYALQSKDGKLSVLGIFSVIRYRKLPVMHPLAYLAWEMEFAAAEIGRPVKIEVKVRDADGGEITGFELEIESEGQGKPGSTPTLTSIVPMRQMRFDKDGRHEFAFFINGNYERSLYVDIRPAKGGPKRQRAR